MIPYPGESLALFRASADGGDRSIETAIIKRGSYTGSGATDATLTAGHEWRAWVQSGTASYLDSGAEDVVVSWVVEVLSGTATFVAGESYDPAYGDDTLAPASSLGTYTVTGPATLVIPSGFTCADVYDGADAMMLHLAATAGSVVVQQVKLRVWPPGGALGGWSDLMPSWSTTPANPGHWEATVDMLGHVTGAGSAEGAWDAALSAFHADADAEAVTQSRAFATFTPSSVPSLVFANQGITAHGDGTFEAASEVGARLIMLRGSDWSTRDPISSDLVEGVDWIRPPTEVQGDLLYFAQQVGEGSTEWQDATLTLARDPSSDDVPGDFTLYTANGVWADLDPTLGVAFEVPLPTSGSGSDGTHSLPTAGLMIYAVLSHTLVTGASDTYPGWAPTSPFSDGWTESLITASLGPVKTYAVMPPYRVWSPTAALSPVLRWWPRNDGLRATSPARFGQMSSYQSGRGGGYQ